MKHAQSRIITGALIAILGSTALAAEPLTITIQSSQPAQAEGFETPSTFYS